MWCATEKISTGGQAANLARLNLPPIAAECLYIVYSALAYAINYHTVNAIIGSSELREVVDFELEQCIGMFFPKA
jgi:hypothetical protein